MRCRLIWLVILLTMAGCATKQDDVSQPLPTSTALNDTVVVESSATPAHAVESATPELTATPAITATPEITPTATPKVTPTPKDSVSPEVTPSPTVTATPKVVKTPQASVKSAKEFSGIQLLSEGGWQTIGGVVSLPGMYRSSNPLTVELAGGGTADFSGGSQFWISAERNTLRLLSGTVVLNSADETIELLDEFGTSVRVEDGHIVARSFDHRMEYQNFSGRVLSESYGEAEGVIDDLKAKQFKAGEILVSNAAQAAFVRGGADVNIGVFMLGANEDLSKELLAISRPAGEFGFDAIKERSTDYVNPKKGFGLMSGEREPEPAIWIKHPSHAETNWNREIRWKTNKRVRRKIKGCFLRLFRVLDDGEEALLWTAVTKRKVKSIEVPDYVEMPYGKYRIVLNPIVGRDVVDLESVRSFQLKEKTEVRSRPLPPPPELSGPVVFKVERLQTNGSPLVTRARRGLWELSRDFEVRDRHTVFLKVGQLLKARLPDGQSMLLSGGARTRFVLPKGESDGLVAQLFYGSLWHRRSNEQKRFTVVTNLGMIKAAGPSTEFAVVAHPRNALVMVSEGALTVISNQKEFEVKSGQMFDLKKHTYTDVSSRAQGLASIGFGAFEKVLPWLTNIK